MTPFIPTLPKRSTISPARIGNTILIWFQKNDATLCAGYHTWLPSQNRTNQARQQADFHHQGQEIREGNN